MNGLLIPPFMENNKINCHYPQFNNCLRSMWCGFLNKEKKIKKEVKKTIKTEPIKKILNIAENNKEIKQYDIILPTVDISELIYIYNTTIGMFHKCQEILTDTINYILEYEAVKPLIITEYYLEKTIMYPTKEVLEFVSILKGRVLNMLTNVHELIQIIAVLNFEPFVDIERKLIDHLKSIGYTDDDIVLVGGATLTDVEQKVLDIKDKLKILSDSFNNYDFLKNGTKFKTIDSLMKELNRLKTNIETIPDTDLGSATVTGHSTADKKELQYFDIDLKNTIIPQSMKDLFHTELNSRSTGTNDVSLIKHECALRDFGTLVREKLEAYKIMTGNISDDETDNLNALGKLKNMKDIEYTDSDFTFVIDPSAELQGQLVQTQQNIADVNTQIISIEQEITDIQFEIDKYNELNLLKMSNYSVYFNFFKAYTGLLEYDSTIEQEIRTKYNIPNILYNPKITDLITFIVHRYREPIPYHILEEEKDNITKSLENIKDMIHSRQTVYKEQWLHYVNNHNPITTTTSIDDFVRGAGNLTPIKTLGGKIVQYNNTMHQIKKRILKILDDRTDYKNYLRVVEKYIDYSNRIKIFTDSQLGKYLLSNRYDINVLDLDDYVSRNSRELQTKLIQLMATMEGYRTEKTRLNESLSRIRESIRALPPAGSTIIESPDIVTLKTQTIKKLLNRLKAQLTIFNMELARCSDQIISLDNEFARKLPRTISLSESTLSTKWYNRGGGTKVSTDVTEIKRELVTSQRNYKETTALFQELAQNVHKFKSMYSSRRDDVLKTLFDNQMAIYHVFYIMTILTEILTSGFHTTVSLVMFNTINSKIQSTIQKPYFDITLNRAKIFGNLLQRQFNEVHGGTSLLVIDQNKKSYLDIIMFVHLGKFL